MAGVVSNSRLLLDERGHARQGPQIGAEPLRARARAQRPLDGRELRRIQLRLPARPPCPFEPGPSLRLPGVEPVVGTDPADS